MEKLRITSVQRIGNSLGVIIPAHVARDLNFRRGDQVLFALYTSGNISLRKLTDAELLELKPPITKI
jgi:antitoxin component of MazEF toxin-antitoxin module